MFRPSQGKQRIPVGNQLLFVKQYKKQANEGDFLALEAEFIEKLKELSALELKDLKYRLIHGVRSTEGAVSIWTSIILPFLLVLLTIVISINVAQIEDEAFIFYILLIVVWGVAAIVIFSIISHRYMNQKWEGMFYQFYYDILVDYESNREEE